MSKALLLLSLLLMAWPILAHATPDTDPTARRAQNPAPYRSKDIKPQAVLKIEGDDNGPIENATINDVYESCKYHIPERFTPQAREYYCACNAAAVQGNFLNKELRELQVEDNHVATNKTYAKYIEKAVVPCLVDSPLQQIEYLDCLVNSTYDNRVGSPTQYCTCTANKLRDHARRYALPEIMQEIISMPSSYKKEPVNALWASHSYVRTRTESRDDCMMGK